MKNMSSKDYAKAKLGAWAKKLNGKMKGFKSVHKKVVG